MVNSDARRLVNLIYELVADRLKDDSLYCKAVQVAVEKALGEWHKDVLIGPYIPVLAEICSERRATLDDIVEQTLYFFFSYQEADDKLHLDFYNYLRAHNKIRPTPPLERSYGFQYVKGKNSRSFATIWAKGRVVLPGDEFIGYYGLSDERQDRIRIPLYQDSNFSTQVDNSATIDDKEPGIMLDFPLPPDLRSRSGAQKSPLKIKVSFQRRERDLSFRVDWVEGDKETKIKSGILSDEFNQLAEQEAIGPPHLAEWRRNLKCMIDICWDFCKACEQRIEQYEGFNGIKVKLEKSTTKALQALRNDDEGEGMRMLSQLFKDWLELGHIANSFSNMRIVEIVAPALSKEVQDIANKWIDAYNNQDEEGQRYYFAQMGRVRKRALKEYYDDRPEEYARFQLDETIMQAFKLFYSDSASLPIYGSPIAHNKIERLIEFAASILNNYLDMLTSTQISELQRALTDVKQATKSNDSQVLTEKMTTLEAQLVQLGPPATLAIIASMDDDDITRFPALRRLQEFAGHIQAAIEQGNISELDQLYREFLDEFHQIIDELLPSENERLTGDLVLLQKAMIFSLPILTPGSENMQLEALARRATRFAENWVADLSPDLVAKLHYLSEEAKAALQSDDFSRMRKIAKDIVFTLLEAGAPLIAFMAASYLEDNGQVEKMLAAYQGSDSGRQVSQVESDKKWRSLAYDLSGVMLNKIEMRIKGALKQDKRLDLEKALLESSQLAAFGNWDAAVHRLEEPLTVTDAGDIDKYDFLIDYLEQFLDSKHARLLDPDQIEKLQSGLYSLRKSIAVNAQMFKKMVRDLRDNLTSAAAEIVTAKAGHSIPNFRQLIHDIIITRLPDYPEAADELAIMIESLVAMPMSVERNDVIGLLTALDEPVVNQ